MTVDAEDWLLDEIASTAVRLAAACFAAIVSGEFDAKILLGRFAHDEAVLLRRACARFDEVATRTRAPTTLAAALEGRVVPIPDRPGPAFVACTDWAPYRGAPATSPLADEPTHRYYRERTAVRTRQMAELRAAGRSACVAPATRRSLADLVAALRAIERPGRPATLRLSDAREPVGSTGAPLNALLQQNLVNLEIPTIELCCSLILESGDLPLEFVTDMARQAWDEARHAQLFWTRLSALGGAVDDYSASTVLWRMCRGQSLAIRLALHQCAGEWVGVDGAAWYRDAATRAGDPETAALFDAVMRDELGHVRLGHRWLGVLCPDGQDRAATRAAAAALRRAAGKSADGPLAFPLDEALCRAAGFEDDEIADLATRYRLHGSLAEAAMRP